MKNWVILVSVIAWCVALLAAQKYDNTSCKTLLPVIKPGSLWSTTEKVDSAFGEPVSSEETTEDQDDDDNDDGDEENEEVNFDLVPALERSPYKIETSSLKYRRNRVMTIKIEGSKLTGLLLQARQRFPSSLSSRPTFVGNFIDVPEGFQTMDCNPEESPYRSNTVFNTNKRIKSGVKLSWKAPSNNFESVEFFATIIRGKYYWTHIRSMPIFFNEFPPSFVKCGKELSCHQHVKSHAHCEDGFCNDYFVMSEVSDEDVTFYIGGSVESDTGFVGIAFTDDKQKLSILDLSVCRKKDHRTVDMASYRVDKSIGHVVRQFDIMSSVTTDIDGDYIWCSFRRPLTHPEDKNVADLSKDLYYMLIRGHLDSMNDPFLPNEEDMVKEIKHWKPTVVSNTIDYYGGATAASLSWGLVFVIFITNVWRLIH